MYCTNCGTQIDNDAKFCTSCGTATGLTQAPPVQQEVKQQAPVMQPQQNASQFQAQQDMNQMSQPSLNAVAVPVQIKTGLLKSEPYIFLFSQTQTIVVYIGKDQYNNIIQNTETEGGFIKKALSKMAAFRDYANDLGMRSLQEVMNMYPGSLIVGNAQIDKLRINQDYDPDDNMSSSDYHFELRFGGEKYKGTLDKTVNIRDIKRPLKNIFGRRAKI